MANQVMFHHNVSHSTYYDPYYSRRRLSRKPIKSAPIMLHIEIFHQLKKLVYDDPADSTRILDSTLLLRQHCFWSNIDVLRNNSESALRFLSPKFRRVGINSIFFSRLADAIRETVITSSHELPLNKRRVILPVVCRVYTDAVGTINEPNRREPNEEFDGMLPAAVEALSMLKKNEKVKKKNEKVKKNSECSVCLEDVGEFGSAMPCKHIFHEECIVKWLKRSHYCPVCRFELPTAMT